jgi:hypothetical protein
MPYAFYRAGWALSTLTLGFVTVMATLTALWLVDVSLRAQFVKRQLQLIRGGVEAEGAGDMPVSTRVQHRFEVNELVEMFMGLRARRFYELLVIVYLVGALWSYSSVFASSLASHVGMPGISGECDIYKDGSSSCNNLYLTYMAIFAVVVLPLTCLDLTEMKAMQIALPALAPGPYQSAVTSVWNAHLREDSYGCLVVAHADSSVPLSTAVALQSAPLSDLRFLLVQRATTGARHNVMSELQEWPSVAGAKAEWWVRRGRSA